MPRTVVNSLFGPPVLLRCCEGRSPKECLNLCILDGEPVKQSEGVVNVGRMEDSEVVQTGEVLFNGGARASAARGE